MHPCHAPLRREAGWKQIQLCWHWGYGELVNCVWIAVLSLVSLAAIQDATAQIPPSITAPPRSQTNYAGNNVILGVAVTGTEPFSYQWRFNDTPMVGKTNALLFLPMTTTNDTGSYAVVVTNISGAVTSSSAALTVNPRLYAFFP